MIARTNVLGKPATSHTVAVTIPSTHNFTFGNDKLVRPADSVVLDRLTEQIIRNFSAMFGGATVTNGRGVWVDSDTNELVYENVTIVQSNTGNVTAENIKDVANIAFAIKALFNQDSVKIDIDNESWFV